LFAGCGSNANQPINNVNAANPNTAKPAAAPTKDELVALETKAFDAWKNKDRKFFENFLTDDFVGLGPTGRMDRASLIKDIVDTKCDIKSFSFSDAQMTPAGADAAVLTLKAAEDYSCEGKKAPPATWAATVYVRRGDQWKAIYHNEIPVGGAPPNDVANTDAKPVAAEDKPADATTAPLLAVEKQGWEGWKNRDAKALDAIVTKDLVLIDPSGARFDKAGAIKSWTEPKCEIKSTALSEASGVSLGKDAGLLTYKASADGSCEGTKLTGLWGTTVFVKDGDAWKAVFIFESPA
jgi:ketosteroid isomerase-like protein